MIKHEREQLNSEAQRNYMFLRFGKGCRAVVTDWRKAIILVAYVVVAIWLIDIGIIKEFVGAISYAYASHVDMLPLLGQITAQIAIILSALIGLFVLLIVFGMPSGGKAMRGNLLRIGLANHAGEAPVLISKRIRPFDKKMTILEFMSFGIPYSDWVDKRAKIESALNLNVVEISHGKDKRHILLSVVSAKNALPKMINWQDSFLSKDNFDLILGESLRGVEMVNLSLIPHILLGGATGSGKSVLLKLLVMQCIKKGAAVSIADFKGGVDFPSTWHKHCDIVTDEKALQEVLSGIVDELERRKIILKNSGHANIDEYNANADIKSYLPRHIFVCDEIAEILDKTGLDKSQKELISSIESKLATIARQGRAFGIHLILATQRPDATILSGQIKNNINFRVCGRADNVLSQIILDSTAASDEIPSNAQGRFLTHDGVVFQGYWFDENNVLG